MSEKIQACFRRLSGHDTRMRLIAYTVAGDIPAGAAIAEQARRCHDWVRAGVDILEIGVPFSDPMADGPTIQRAHARALERGTKLGDVFTLIEAIRADGCQAPVVLMSYLNPLLQYGRRRVLDSLRQCAVDGLLLVDCPSVEYPDLFDDLLNNGIDPILLAAPNTGSSRLRQLLHYARGFVYALSLKGVTGSALTDYGAVGGMVERIRAQSSLPIAVGFGIREPGQLRALPAGIDGVVVGSALAELTEQSRAVACPAAIDLIRQFH